MGYRVRVRAMDPNTGTMKEANKTVEGINLEQAVVKQAELKEEIRRGARSVVAARQKYGDYAESLLRRKIATGQLSTAASRRSWSDAQDLHLLPAFGDWYVDAIRRLDIEEWKAEQARKLMARKGRERKPPSPHTVNGRLRVLLSTLRSAVVDLELTNDPTLAVHPLDTSMHQTFTEEEPNSLTTEELPACSCLALPTVHCLVRHLDRDTADHR